MVCPQCSEHLPLEFEGLPLCSTCNSRFHFGNCSAVNEPGWVKRGREAQLVWVCHKCKPNKKLGNTRTPILTQQDLGSTSSSTAGLNVSLTSNSETATSDQSNLLVDAAAASKKRCFDDIASPPPKLPVFKDLDEKCEFILNQVMKLVQQNARLINDFQQIRDDCAAIKENQKLDAGAIAELRDFARVDAQKITDLEFRNRALEDYTRADNLLIHGLPPQKTEAETFGTVFSASKAVGMELTYDDLSACHSLGAPRDGAVRIVCRFVRRWKRNQFHATFNGAKITTATLGLPGEVRKLFATDHLSPETSRIYAEAKRHSMRFGGPLYYVFIRNRRVLVRVNDGDSPTEIRSIEHLRSLIDDGVQRDENMEIQHSNGS